MPSLREVKHECQYRRIKDEKTMWISPELSLGRSLKCVEKDVIEMISMAYGEAC